MKYSMVKQFSNNSIDNIFNFYNKIIDFGKILFVTVQSFVDIWIAFYLIFYNAIMYIYYLILFMIDKGADESRSTIFFWQKIPRRMTSKRSVLVTETRNPIPAMYGRKKIIPKMSKPAVSSVKIDSTRLTGGRPVHAKKSIFKTIFELFINFFQIIAELIISPFKAIILFFDRNKAPRPEEEGDQKKVSLIDQYMKEYEQKRKA